MQIGFLGERYAAEYRPVAAVKTGLGGVPAEGVPAAVGMPAGPLGRNFDLLQIGFGTGRGGPSEFRFDAGGVSAAGKTECRTCESRRYQDRSDDSSVSFQSPTKISASGAAFAVASHEMEHVLHEKASAERDGREIVSQSVTIKRDICPECGTVYIAGGETTTVSRGKAEKAYADARKAAARAGMSGGPASR